MEYLIKNKKLELKYVPGKGAWTYHIQIPNTKHIVGRWGSLKVSGFIDDYKIDSINLFTLTGQDKLISVNSKIRKAINKKGGDSVKVTLFFIADGLQISEKEILNIFKDAGVLPAFNKLSPEQKQKLIGRIMVEKSEDRQTKTIVKCIEDLDKQ